ncbi:uncharacterized protein NPIL_570361 [Nephila pilipes]|uniref:Uncharacterized protein n=1 Tax=Nephila pilipes TaxID=299642 RepID=A0A8X6JT75_NEPPI|nr:uncharacterized protein NPIL_570361 [Nephila pilipes]
MKLFVTSALIALHVVAVFCQRYADRNPLPVDTLPFSDNYDEDYTEGYDFLEDKDIYRWNVNEFPHPQEHFRYCNRMKASYICDPDQVLTRDEADKLDVYIRKLYKETPCICTECKGDSGGIIVGIALLKHMFQPYNQHPSKTIRSFTQTLREKWNLGKCDNDILIVVATTDRLSYTDVGKETAFYVTLDEAHRIFLENKAHFSAGNFYEGLNGMLTDYHTRTRIMKSRSKENDQGLNLGLISGSIIGAIVILGIILFLIFIVYRRMKKQKDPEKAEYNLYGQSESLSAKDIKVSHFPMKSSEKLQSSSTKYQPCDTDEKDLPANGFKIDEDDVIDTTLAVPINLDDTQHTTTTTVDTSTTEMLDRDLTAAVEGIAQTFQPKRQFRGHETDL